MYHFAMDLQKLIYKKIDIFSKYIKNWCKQCDMLQSSSIYIMIIHLNMQLVKLLIPNQI